MNGDCLRYISPRSRLPERVPRLLSKQDFFLSLSFPSSLPFQCMQDIQPRWVFNFLYLIKMSFLFQREQRSVVLISNPSILMRMREGERELINMPILVPFLMLIWDGNRKFKVPYLIYCCRFLFSLLWKMPVMQFLMRELG